MNELLTNQIRIEAQVARTGRAKCRICGTQVGKNCFIVKVIGYRINQSYHPECLNNLTIVLADYVKQMKDKGVEPVIRAVNGKVKIGYYKRIGDKKFRFTSVQVIDTNPQKEGTSNVQERPESNTPEATGRSNEGVKE